MKLKYYLRGIGIGIVVTTLIFMVSILINKSDGDTWLPAEDNNSKTLADMFGTEMEDTEGEDTETAKNSAAKTADQKTAEVKSTPGTEEEASPKDAGEQKDSQAPKDTENQAGSQEEPASGSSKTEAEKVRFEIGGGEYSDVTCRRLQQEKLIDDAEKFNEFLIQNKYDNYILPGVYDIPRGATYEEIARLLTTKVEEN